MENKKYWDPIGMNIKIGNFKKDCEGMRKKLKEIQDDPKKLIKERRLVWIIAIAGTILALASMQLSTHLGSVLLIGAWVYLIAFYIKIKGLQKDLVKLSIADKEGWVYSPHPNYKRWVKFTDSFSEFFRKGNCGQNLQDEFWGSFENKGKEVDLWMGIFEYKIKRNNSKGGSNTTTYYKNVFALHIPKKLKTDFRLVPEHFGHKFLNFFTRKEINTESIEFNKEFAFYYKGKKAENQLEIFKTLSPAVQKKILELRKVRGPFSIWIRDDIILAMFDGLLLKKMKTNFFKKVEVAKADLSVIEKMLKDVSDIGGGIISYLD